MPPAMSWAWCRGDHGRFRGDQGRFSLVYSLCLARGLPREAGEQCRAKLGL